ELWHAPQMAEVVAETLGRLVRNSDGFVAVANDAIRRSAPCDAGMSLRPPGHVPLSMTDPSTGCRFGLRVVRRGVDFVVEGTGTVPFTYNLGTAATDDLLGFLHRHRGRCTPNVFAPIFLFRAGVGGI